MIPLSDEARQQWRQEIEHARRGIDRLKARWQANLDAIVTLPTTTPTQSVPPVVHVPKDFAIIEQKKAQLFFQTPELRLQPIEPLMSGREDAITIHEKVLNEKLGSDGVNLKRVADSVIFDVLCPSGIGAVKIGYDVTTTRIVSQQPRLDAQGAPQVDPFTGQPVLMPVEVDVPIWEDYYIRRIPPTKLLLPAGFRSAQFDEAPWMGFEFTMPIRQARRHWDLPETFEGTQTQDERLFTYDWIEPSVQSLVVGVELWYKASLYDETVVHPEQLRTLVLIDGVDDPVDHRDSPDQTIGPDGRLTADSMIGFPIHPLTLRVLADSSYVPSDSTILRPLLDELDEGRNMMVQQRRRALPMRGFDRNRVDPEIAEKIARGELQSMIPMDGPLQDAVWEVARAQFPRENFTFNDIIERDIEQAISVGSNQLGVRDDTARTATEVQQIQSATAVRLDAERAVVLDWILRAVAKFDSLCQRYATEQSVTEIVGADGAKRWAAWDKHTIAGRFAYRAVPDSQIRLDAAQDRRMALQLYQMTAQDPNVVRVELLKSLFRKFGLDPSKLIVDQLPPKGPDPPNLSFRFGGDDLDPLLPRFPIVLELMRQGGYQISPEALQQAQQHAAAQIMAGVGFGPGMAGRDTGQGVARPDGQHGGPAAQVSPLSKRQMTRGDARMTETNDAEMM